jgi:hypothetical protein
MGSLKFVTSVTTPTDLTVPDSYCMFHFIETATTDLTKLDDPQK